MQRLILGQVLTRRDIARLYGGNARAFLPRNSGGDVVAGCFDPAMNPRVPAEVLVHNSTRAVLAALRFVDESRPARLVRDRPHPIDSLTCNTRSIPVFTKREPNVWEYVGHFRATAYITETDQVAARVYEIHPRIYARHAREYGEMKGILLLDEA